MIAVSVIVPIYNVEEYLHKCINSIINQTLNNIEIICINDSSTDNSLSILKEYAKQDKRVKIINFENNQGVALARNAGLEIAKGEYVCFIDADDWIDGDFLSQLYQRAIINNSDIVMAPMIEIDYNGNAFLREETQKLFDSGDKFYGCTDFKPAIYKKALIKENDINFPPKVILCEDMLFLTQILIKAKNVSVVMDTKYFYRRRLNSGNSQLLNTNQIESALPILEKIANLFLECELSEGVYFAYNNILNILITFSIKTQESNAKKCLKLLYSLYDNFKQKDKLNTPPFIKMFANLEEEIRIKKALFILRTVKLTKEKIKNGENK